MIKLTAEYLARLVAGFGGGWTRFWFTPSDPVTLSIIRPLTGLVALYLHATLAFDLVAFFGPNGLLPSADIAPLESGSFSYLNYLHTPAELWTVHLLGAVALLLFTLGIWTRATSVLALVVFLSDVQRAPMLTGRTEPVLAMLMLYLCLAPCGRRYSLDAWLAKRSSTSSPGTIPPTNPLSTMTTIATRLIQVHLSLLVAMMAFSMLSGETWWSGLGVWWLLARPGARLVDLTWLYRSPKLLDGWAHLIVALELGFPLLVWIPLARPLVLVLAVVLWGSLGLLSGEITFAVMLAIASLAFVSPAAMQQCLHKH